MRSSFIDRARAQEPALMDGLLAFLQDPACENFETILPDHWPRPPLPPRKGNAPAILFVEDFDQRPAEEPAPAEPEIIAPVFTEADIDAARQAGRQEGLAEALTEHHAVQAQLCAAAISAIGDAMAATRADAQAVAQRAADDLSASILALLQAALPAASEALAGSEVAALLAVILPALKREPEVELRLHPATLPGIEAELKTLLPDFAGRLALTADAALAPADTAVVWRDGGARRDTGKLWADLRTVLQPFALPSLSTILKGIENEQ